MISQRSFCTIEGRSSAYKLREFGFVNKFIKAIKGE